ncbi:hypothetical protein [Bartonella doshiae]|uniref:hypothetical protein n=1 Tax=Bartonella doshiae TaxID=33044 RepID=UPI000A45A70C|nr:hypothetical protein [Bartonella doshiae]
MKKVPEYIIQTAKEINNQLSSLDFPFFLFDADNVLKKVKMLMQACKKSFININLTVSLQSCLLAIFCKLLAEEGVNAKVRSADEFRIASVTGFPNNRIILSGCYKTLEDLSLAMKKDALIHVGSINEFHKLKILAASKNKPYGVSIKLSSYNEKKDSCFGITKEEYIKDILPLLSKSETLYLKGFSLYIDFHLESLAKTTDALNDWFPFLVEHMPPSGYLYIDSNFPIGSFLSNSKLEISNPETFFRTIRDVLNTYAPEISEKWKLIFEYGYLLQHRK